MSPLHQRTQARLLAGKVVRTRGDFGGTFVYDHATKQVMQLVGVPAQADMPNGPSSTKREPVGTIAQFLGTLNG